MAKSTTIGVIGLGRMGGPLARRLMRSKLPLMVWDSVAECRKPFENRKNVCVATPAAMAHVRVAHFWRAMPREQAPRVAFFQHVQRFHEPPDVAVQAAYLALTGAPARPVRDGLIRKITTVLQQR